MSGTATTNLDLQYLDASQSQPEVKVNDAWNKIDAAIGEGQGIEVSNATASPAIVARALELQFEGAGVTVEHETGGKAIITIPGGAGTSVTVSDGTHSVAEVTEIVFTSGATVTVSGTTAEVAVASAGVSGNSGSGTNASSSVTLSGAAAVIDASAASLYLIDLTVTTTVTLAGAVANKDAELLLYVIQGGSAAAKITWGTSIAWAGGVAPVLTTNLGHGDIIRLACGDGATWFGYQVATNVFAPPTGTYDLTVMADNPVAYWTLSDTTGTVPIDSGPNNLAGHYVGTAGTGYQIAQPPIASGLGDSIMLGIGGNTGYIDVPHNSAFDLLDGHYTIEIWIKPTQLSGTTDCFSKSELGAWRFCMQGSQMAMWITGNEILDSKTVFVANEVYHCVYTNDPTNNVGKLYVNGVLDSSVANAPAPNDTSNDIVIGALPQYYFQQYTGFISNCALYNSVLSADRVAAHYAAGT